MAGHVAGHVAGHAASEPAIERKQVVFSQYPRPADGPRGPSAGNTDLPSLVNITVMGYSLRTDDDIRYTEWVRFCGNYTADGRIQTSGPQWNELRARELYALRSDPLELHNRAQDAAFAPLVASLSKRLHAGWQAAIPAA
mgnify:CR=1 FL=1